LEQVSFDSGMKRRRSQR